MDKKAAAIAAGAAVAGIALATVAASHAQGPLKQGAVQTSVTVEPVSPYPGEEAVATVTTDPPTQGLALALEVDGQKVGDFPLTDQGGIASMPVVFSSSGDLSLQAVPA